MFKNIFLLVLMIFLCNTSLSFAQWEKCNLDLSNTGVYSISSYNNVVYAGSKGMGLYYSSDSGLNWTSITSTEYDISQINKVTLHENRIYLGTHFSGVMVSTDYGKNWIPKNSSNIGLDIWTIVFENDNIFITTYENGVFISSDQGSTWLERNSGLLSLYTTDLVIQDSLLFVGTVGEGLFVSSNYGKNWVQSNNGINGNIIIPLIVNKSSIYLGTYSSEGNSGFVYRSTNQGKNWIVLNNGIPEVKINSIAGRDNLLIVGTYGAGVYISTNNGDSWEEKNAGLYDGLNKNVLSISINDEYVFIGTWGSIFRCKISDLITGIDEIQFFNNTLSLAPNPSTCTVHISFTLSMENYITLQITNNLGQVVNELISNKMFEKGKHNIDYSTLNLAKGIYFVSIKASGKVISEEKLIIK